MKILLTIEKIENDQVIFKDENDRLVTWPLNLLPATPKVGDKIPFTIGDDSGLAKNILNEILSAE